MSDFTLDEKFNFAEVRAREVTAEKHFFDAAQPFFPLGFSVGNRNHGHWDVFAQMCPGKASAWQAAHPEGSTSATDRDREQPGNVIVFDERWDPHRPHPRETMKFRSVMGAMVYIMEELMQEPARS